MAPDNRTTDMDIAPEEFRRLGYRVIDMMADWLARESRDPVLEKTGGDSLRSRLSGTLPEQPTDADAVLTELRDTVMRHSRANGHPGYGAYVCASADPLGMLADALASALNQNVTAWRSAPAATTVERQVVQWLDEFVGFDGGGHGLLLGGGSAANLHGLRCAMEDATAREDAARDRMTVYVSSETHLSLAKAARTLGLSDERIRTVPVDARRRMDPEALERMVMADRGDELIPVMVCGSAGTANDGTIDPLERIADVAERRHVWFHVDGAYGAPAAATEEYAWLGDAFRRADSMSLDPHKWLYAPIDVGCFLIRHPAVARAAFSESAEYTRVHETDPVESFAFFDHGMELSRRFRALKIWLPFRIRGARAIADQIRENIETRKALDDLIEGHDELERLGSGLSITCFRYRVDGRDDEALNELNENILARVLDSGRFLMSPTRLEGRYALRFCIVNFRTRAAHMEDLVDRVLEAGRKLTQ